MFETSKEAYIWLLDKFIAHRPDVLENEFQRNRIVRGGGRLYLAQHANKLFGRSPHLGEDVNNFKPVCGGWVAITNLNNDVKFMVLCRFARVAGFKYGEDWTWDDGTNREPPGKVIDLDDL